MAKKKRGKKPVVNRPAQFGDRIRRLTAMKQALLDSIQRTELDRNSAQYNSSVRKLFGSALQESIAKNRRSGRYEAMERLKLNGHLKRAAKILRCDDKSLTSILRYWVNDALEKRQLDDVISLAIDETSFKKGHKYVTVVIDSAKRAVIDVEPGKDKSAVENFARKLCEKSCDKNNITSVTCDMSKAFTNAVSERFPNADITIDKFHVKQIVLNALDEVRKAEQKESQSKLGLFRGRRLFMIPEQKLTNEQAASIAALSKSSPKTGRAYRIVSAFDLFCDCESFDVAEKAFDKLYSWMRRCRLEPFKCTALTPITA